MTFTIDTGPNIWGIVNPAEGKGWFRYYANVALPPHLMFEFTAPPWIRSGIQPFAWDFIPTTENQTYPIIRIAVGRQVRIQRYGGPALPQSRHILNLMNPLMEVYRLQDDSLLPNPEAPIEPSRLLRSPYRWLAGAQPTIDYENRNLYIPQLSPQSLQSAVVHHLPNGLVARHVNNEWELRIRVPEDQRGAFAYELVGRPQGYHIRIVRTPNVDIRANVSWDFEEGASQIRVEEAIRRVDDVPPQGSQLDPRRYNFQHLPGSRFEWTLSPRSRERLQLAIEVVISSLPYIGPLYEMAQLVYAVSTGRNFWGEPVDIEEIAVMGVMALLSIGSADEILKIIRRIARERSTLRALLSPDTYQAVQRTVDPALEDAIRNMSSRQRRAVAELLERYMEGTATVDQVLESFHGAVGEQFLRNLNQQRLLRIFNDDYTGFRDPVLAWGYRRYKSGGGRSDPVTWAKRQRAPRRGGASRGGLYRLYLESRLGDNPVDVINNALRRGEIPRVTSEAVAVFDRLGNRPDLYSDIRHIVQVRRGVGYLFEADHLLEQRFMLSPRVGTSLDESNMIAILVPKNPAVARQLRIRGREFVYIHSQKTELLRRLIPNGAEDLFTNQQWWDAHAYVFKSLGVEESVFLEPLKDMFKEALEEAGKRINYHTNQTQAMFRPESGWLQAHSPQAPTP